MKQEIEVEEQDIELPYTPRPMWMEKIHPALDKYKRAVLVDHRRFGKTEGMLAHIEKEAIRDDKLMPRYAYVAPYRNQAKKIAWSLLKMFVAKIPGMKINESDLYVEFPTKHEGADGARIYIFGADKPDTIRGTYWDGVVLDEYADIKKEVWEKILLPTLSGRDGFAYFIGTPKGQNQFYEIYKYALAHRKATKKNPAWFVSICTVYDNFEYCKRYLEKLAKAKGQECADAYAAKVAINIEKWAAEIEEAKETQSESTFRQEFMVDFTASASDVVIPIDLIDQCCARTLGEQDVPPEEPVILGVDVARFGDDRTVIFKRQGLWVEKPRVYTKLDVTEVADRVVFAINDYHPDMVFIDSGNMGAGVIDVLRRRGYSCIEEVAFGSKAGRSERYENLRAEMYFKLKEGMEQGLAIPDDPDLKKELAVTQYTFTRRGRIQIQPKEEIKSLMGASPDIADALALTYARPVGPRWRRRERGFDNDSQVLMCNTKYTILDEKNLLDFNF